MEMVAVPAALARALGISGSATGMPAAPAGKGGKGGKGGGGKGFQAHPQNARPTPSYAELKEVCSTPPADGVAQGSGENFATILGAGPGRRENPLKAPRRLDLSLIHI